jgi:hypothetical protein
MMRMITTKAVINSDNSNLPYLQMMQFIANNELELATQNGQIVVWADSVGAENMLISLTKDGYASIIGNFPIRWVVEDGDLVQLTLENLATADLSTLTDIGPVDNINVDINGESNG